MKTLPCDQLFPESPISSFGNQPPSLNLKIETRLEREIEFNQARLKNTGRKIPEQEIQQAKNVRIIEQLQAARYPALLHR